MSQTLMRGCDAIAAPLAQCYVTLEGKRYNFMQMIDFEARMIKIRQELPILGKNGVGHKSGGWRGVFSGHAHFNQSVLRSMLYAYKQTGKEVYFDIQVTNEDPACGAGAQTVILLDCTLDGGVLTKFDANGKFLTEAVSGTFEDFRIPQQFASLPGMEL